MLFLTGANVPKKAVMSTRAGSNLKSNVFNEGNESLYDPYYGFPVREGLTNVPWPGKNQNKVSFWSC